ncbi:RNA methyltransferase [Desulfitobacterium sp.]|uniref:RNA methyltransferase n=1 Tax=Desulfitobacterium sp. TaxID=49981 RepID=UPI002B217107|nr:RNA methyltransferase [Desulfitobacterium sp.]MEA4900180.1 RNA methyltransferase [Desulfitobacterium sp.]
MGDLYLALIHAPVYNKNMETIATSITNLDIHDIARSAMTFGAKRYYIVHPAEAQRALALRIMGYWQEGFGSEYNQNRQEAFSRVRLASDLAEVEAEIEKEQGRRALKVATDAHQNPNTISYSALRQRIEETDDPVLLLFGTGWGLIQEVLDSCDLILDPVYGPGEWNHLSVRSAASIILDRLRGH